SVPPDVPKFAQIARPKPVSPKIVAVQPGRTVPDDHPLAVGRGSAAGIGVSFMRRFGLGILDRLLPKLVAGLAVEAVQRPLFSLVGRGRDEHPAVRDDRAAVSVAGQFGLPANVLLRSPLGGGLWLLRHAVVLRPPKHRPVGGDSRKDG